MVALWTDGSTVERKDLPIDMRGRIQEEFLQPVLMHVTSHCTIEIVLTIVPQCSRTRASARKKDPYRKEWAYSSDLNLRFCKSRFAALLLHLLAQFLIMVFEIKVYSDSKNMSIEEVKEQLLFEVE